LVLFNAWHKTKKGKVHRREDLAHGMEFKTWNGGENSGNWSFKAFDFLPDTDLVGVLEWDPALDALDAPVRITGILPASLYSQSAAQVMRRKRRT
jgi:hypothetical protein